MIYIHSQGACILNWVVVYGINYGNVLDLHTFFKRHLYHKLYAITKPCNYGHYFVLIREQKNQAYIFVVFAFHESF